jgi:pimeloyl-ACP methyl ester carboxylesterase
MNAFTADAAASDSSSLLLSAGGFDLACSRWGRLHHGTGDRPAILLVHGLDSSRHVWRVVAPVIAELTGTQVTTVDLPGFGDSITHEKLSFGKLSAVIQAVVSQTQRVVLVGHSMGGALAVHATRRSPTVEGVCLVSSPLPIARFNPQVFLRSIPFKHYLRFRQALSPTEEMQRRLQKGTYDSSLIDVEIAERLYQLAVERAGSPDAARAVKVSARSLLMYMSTPTGMLSDLLATRKSVLVVQGANDRWVPAWPARVAIKLGPNWEGSILQSCGHIPPLEKPDEFAARFADWYLKLNAAR